MPTARARDDQVLGLLLGSRRGLEDAIVYALERNFDLLVLDGTGALGGAGVLGGEWPELRAAPDLALVRDTIATRSMNPLGGCQDRASSYLFG